MTMANVLNFANSEANTERIGSTALYITDNPAAASISEYTKCSSDFHDGGFKSLTNCIGRYLIIMRTGRGMTLDWFTIYEIRAYTVTNLLSGAAVIEAP